MSGTNKIFKFIADHPIISLLTIALLQQQTFTQETLTDPILKASLIAIPMTAIYYLVMKKVIYRSIA